MNPIQQAILKGQREFEKKFVRKSAFGVSIGAIDNLNETGEQQVKSFLAQHDKEMIEAVIEAIQERIIEDNQVVAETTEYKFARQLTNSRLKEIKQTLNQSI